jgi:hypothetical protein
VGRPEPSDPLSIGLYWASRVTTVGLEFALPALGGLWLDRRWPIAPTGVIVGAAIGFAVGMLHLLRISRDVGSHERPKRPL